MAQAPLNTIPSAPPRSQSAHKGTFGTVVVVGGSTGMIGAPALTATAAFRIGAGLVKIMTDPSVLQACLTIEPSATGLLLGDDIGLEELFAGFREKVVLAIGPGMGTGEHERESVAALLELGLPTVLDADGLNNYAALDEPMAQTAAPLVMTPHPGEFRRLAKATGVSLDASDPQTRPEAAAGLARYHRCIVVLKGPGTVVSDGGRHYINATGNPALATAGSGDVLTGMIAGFMAQGMEAFDAAVLGVFLHGAAADQWAERHGFSGMLARDLAELLPATLQRHRNGWNP